MKVNEDEGDYSDELRNLPEIYLANSILQAATDQPFPNQPHKAEHEAIYAKGALDTLCWLLKHDHPNGFVTFIEMLRKRLAESGITFDDESDETVETRRIVRALTLELAQLVQKGKLTLEEAAAQIKFEEEGKYLAGVKNLMPSACKRCGRMHSAKQPHDPQSPLFRSFIIGTKGRIPTWEDAIEPCDEPIQTKLMKVISNGHSWPDVKPLDNSLAKAIGEVIKGCQ